MKTQYSDEDDDSVQCTLINISGSVTLPCYKSSDDWMVPVKMIQKAHFPNQTLDELERIVHVFTDGLRRMSQLEIDELHDFVQAVRYNSFPSLTSTELACKVQQVKENYGKVLEAVFNSTEFTKLNKSKKKSRESNITSQCSLKSLLKQKVKNDENKTTRFSNATMQKLPQSFKDSEQQNAKVSDAQASSDRAAEVNVQDLPELIEISDVNGSKQDNMNNCENKKQTTEMNKQVTNEKSDLSSPSNDKLSNLFDNITRSACEKHGELSFEAQSYQQSPNECDFTEDVMPTNTQFSYSNANDEKNEQSCVDISLKPTENAAAAETVVTVTSKSESNPSEKMEYVARRSCIQAEEFSPTMTSLPRQSREVAISGSHINMFQQAQIPRNLCTSRTSFQYNDSYNVQWASICPIIIPASVQIVQPTIVPIVIEKQSAEVQETSKTAVSVENSNNNNTSSCFDHVLSEFEQHRRSSKFAGTKLKNGDSSSQEKRKKCGKISNEFSKSTVFKVTTNQDRSFPRYRQIQNDVNRDIDNFKRDTDFHDSFASPSKTYAKDDMDFHPNCPTFQPNYAPRNHRALTPSRFDLRTLVSPPLRDQSPPPHPRYIPPKLNNLPQRNVWERPPRMIKEVPYGFNRDQSPTRFRDWSPPVQETSFRNIHETAPREFCKSASPTNNFPIPKRINVPQKRFFNPKPYDFYTHFNRYRPAWGVHRPYHRPYQRYNNFNRFRQQQFSRVVQEKQPEGIKEADEGISSQTEISTPLVTVTSTKPRLAGHKEFVRRVRRDSPVAPESGKTTSCSPGKPQSTMSVSMKDQVSDLIRSIRNSAGVCDPNNSETTDLKAEKNVNEAATSRKPKLTRKTINKKPVKKVENVKTTAVSATSPNSRMAKQTMQKASAVENIDEKHSKQLVVDVKAANLQEHSSKLTSPSILFDFDDFVTLDEEWDDEAKQPSTTSSDEAKQPATTSSDKAKQPSTTCSNEAKQPATTSSDEAKQPSTTSSDEAKQPSSTSSDEAKQPSTTSSDEAKQPSTTSSDEAKEWLVVTDEAADAIKAESAGEDGHRKHDQNWPFISQTSLWEDDIFDDFFIDETNSPLDQAKGTGLKSSESFEEIIVSQSKVVPESRTDTKLSKNSPHPRQWKKLMLEKAKKQDQVISESKRSNDATHDKVDEVSEPSFTHEALNSKSSLVNELELSTSSKNNMIKSFDEDLEKPKDSYDPTLYGDGTDSGIENSDSEKAGAIADDNTGPIVVSPKSETDTSAEELDTISLRNYARLTENLMIQQWKNRKCRVNIENLDLSDGECLKNKDAASVKELGNISKVADKPPTTPTNFTAVQQIEANVDGKTLPGAVHKNSVDQHGIEVNIQKKVQCARKTIYRPRNKSKKSSTSLLHQQFSKEDGDEKVIDKKTEQKTSGKLKRPLSTVTSQENASVAARLLKRRKRLPSISSDEEDLAIDTSKREKLLSREASDLADALDDDDVTLISCEAFLPNANKTGKFNMSEFFNQNIKETDLNVQSPSEQQSENQQTIGIIGDRKAISFVTSSTIHVSPSHASKVVTSPITSSERDVTSLELKRNEVDESGNVLRSSKRNVDWPEADPAGEDLPDLVIEYVGNSEDKTISKKEISLSAVNGAADNENDILERRKGHEIEYATMKVAIKKRDGIPGDKNIAKENFVQETDVTSTNKHEGNNARVELSKTSQMMTSQDGKEICEQSKRILTTAGIEDKSNSKCEKLGTEDDENFKSISAPKIGPNIGTLDDMKTPVLSLPSADICSVTTQSDGESDNISNVGIYESIPLPLATDSQVEQHNDVQSQQTSSGTSSYIMTSSTGSSLASCVPAKTMTSLTGIVKSTESITSSTESITSSTESIASSTEIIASSTEIITSSPESITSSAVIITSSTDDRSLVTIQRNPHNKFKNLSIVPVHIDTSPNSVSKFNFQCLPFRNVVYTQPPRGNTIDASSHVSMTTSLIRDAHKTTSSPPIAVAASTFANTNAASTRASVPAARPNRAPLYPPNTPMSNVPADNTILSRPAESLYGETYHHGIMEVEMRAPPRFLHIPHIHPTPMTTSKIVFLCRRIPYIQIKSPSLPSKEQPSINHSTKTSTNTTISETGTRASSKPVTSTLLVRIRDVACTLRANPTSVFADVLRQQISCYPPNPFVRSVYGLIYNPQAMLLPIMPEMNKLITPEISNEDLMIDLNDFLKTILPNFYLGNFNILKENLADYVSVRTYQPIDDVTPHIIKLFSDSYAYNTILSRGDIGVKLANQIPANKTPMKSRGRPPKRKASKNPKENPKIAKTNSAYSVVGFPLPVHNLLGGSPPLNRPYPSSLSSQPPLFPTYGILTPNVAFIKPPEPRTSVSHDVTSRVSQTNPDIPSNALDPSGGSRKHSVETLLSPPTITSVPATMSNPHFSTGCYDVPMTSQSPGCNGKKNIIPVRPDMLSNYVVVKSPAGQRPDKHEAPSSRGDLTLGARFVIDNGASPQRSFQDLRKILINIQQTSDLDSCYHNNNANNNSASVAPRDEAVNLHRQSIPLDRVSNVDSSFEFAIESSQHEAKMETQFLDEYSNFPVPIKLATGSRRSSSLNTGCDVITNEDLRIESVFTLSGDREMKTSEFLNNVSHGRTRSFSEETPRKDCNTVNKIMDLKKVFETDDLSMGDSRHKRHKDGNKQTKKQMTSPLNETLRKLRHRVSDCVAVRHPGTVDN